MIATQNAADKTQKFLDDFKVSKPVIGKTDTEHVRIGRALHGGAGWGNLEHVVSRRLISNRDTWTGCHGAHQRLHPPVL